jgi:hypothetical protein
MFLISPFHAAVDAARRSRTLARGAAVVYTTRLSKNTDVDMTFENLRRGGMKTTLFQQCGPADFRCAAVCLTTWN